MSDSPYPWKFAWDDPEYKARNKQNGAKGPKARKNPGRAKDVQKAKTASAMNSIRKKLWDDAESRSASFRDAANGKG
jgi:hypothetical protein